MGKPRYNAPSLGHKEDHYILPEEIVIDESLNGRFEPHSQQDVIERAIDMLVNGQLAPVGVRKAHHKEGRPMLVYGYLRTKAALHINKEILPAGGIQVGERFVPVTTPFRLWAAPAEGNELESLKRNIIENLSRKGTSVMDMVINQDRLRKQNMSEEDIAALYNTSVPAVKRNAALLSLARETQILIHRGVITADAGFDLLSLSEDDQKKLIAEQIEKAKSAGAVFDHSEQEFLLHQPDTVNPKFGSSAKSPEAVDGTVPAGVVKETKEGKKARSGISRAVKKAVRQRKQEKGEKGPALSFSEFKKAVASLTDVDEDEAVKEFAEKTLAYCRGDITQKQWDNAVTKLREAK
jgi:hypothetical protein